MRSNYTVLLVALIILPISVGIARAQTIPPYFSEEHCLSNILEAPKPPGSVVENPNIFNSTSDYIDCFMRYKTSNVSINSYSALQDWYRDNLPSSWQVKEDFTDETSFLAGRCTDQQLAELLQVTMFNNGTYRLSSSLTYGNFSEEFCRIVPNITLPKNAVSTETPPTPSAEVALASPTPTLSFSPVPSATYQAEDEFVDESSTELHQEPLPDTKAKLGQRAIAAGVLIVALMGLVGLVITAYMLRKRASRNPEEILSQGEDRSPSIPQGEDSTKEEDNKP